MDARWYSAREIINIQYFLIIQLTFILYLEKISPLEILFICISSCTSIMFHWLGVISGNDMWWYSDHGRGVIYQGEKLGDQHNVSESWIVLKHQLLKCKLSSGKIRMKVSAIIFDSLHIQTQTAWQYFNALFLQLLSYFNFLRINDQWLNCLNIKISNFKAEKTEELEATQWGWRASPPCTSLLGEPRG